MNEEIFFQLNNSKSVLRVLSEVASFHVHLLWHPTPALLDDGLGHSPRENDDGIELCVVEFVHRRRRHVQQGVLSCCYYW